MKKLILVLVLAAAANAGVIRMVTFPVRHPVATVKDTVHVIWKIVW